MLLNGVRGYRLPSQAKSQCSSLPIRYKEMVIAANEVDVWHSLYAGTCTWALLAGYIVFPSAYGAIQRSHMLDESGQVGKYIQTASHKIPYICLASIFCG